MPDQRRTSKRGERGKRPATGREWVGGLLSPPVFVDDPAEPFRAEMALWMELPSGIVVSSEVVHPEAAGGAIARGLLSALERPLAGPPRRPDRIRVANALLAAEVRGATGDTIPVVVGPTPELDELLRLMMESSPAADEELSYLEDDRIGREVVTRFFRAAGLLYGIAPWKTATDDQVLRMDIPALDVDGACISIIGSLGQSRGVMIFPSLAGYEAFLRAAKESDAQTRRSDFGTDWMALTFDPRDELPERMLQEIAEHDWPVEDDDGFPRVERRNSDGASRPLVERDLEIATACATSLSTFFLKYSHMFESETFDPVCESYFDQDDLEVRFTVPYEALSLFDIDAPPDFVEEPAAEPFRPKVGRNAPCPCGSGRKYKKCHLPIDERESSEGVTGDPRHVVDARLEFQLAEYAVARFGDEWLGFRKDFAGGPEALQLARPWSVYGFPVRGRSVVDWYLEERAGPVSKRERSWLEAQRESWLSVWEVLEVEPGEGMTLRDLLSHETRRVREDEGSRTAVARDAVLARVVDCGDVSLLCGVHGRPLLPIDAAEVVRRARGRLRRKRAVPVERLRDGAFGRYLIRRWEEAVAKMLERGAMPSQLRNTDDDPLLLTVDRFDIAPEYRAAVQASVASLEHVQGPESSEDPAVYVFLRPGDGRGGLRGGTVIGQAQFSDRGMRVETNSVERADSLRERLEDACGSRIRFRIREHVDPLSSKVRRGPPVETVPDLDSPELQRVVLEYKRRHYADWIDQQLPALGGKTPREAVRSAGGRTAVDTLLKDMENRERRGAGGQAYDFSEIRRALRLE